MIKPALAFIAILCCTLGQSQNYNLVLKKKHKLVYNFWRSSMIGFQLKNEEWQYGKVISIHKDSIIIKPLKIQYSFMHADTLPSFPTPFALKDIRAFPKKGVIVDFDNGSFRLNKASSKVQAYWLKSGWILRVGGLGYAALNIINSAAHDELSIENNAVPLTIAAAVTAAGVVLGQTYKPVLKVGKKYHLEIFDLSTGQ